MVRLIEKMDQQKFGLMAQKNGGKMTNSSRKVDKFSEIEYRNENGEKHREDGPAVIYSDGTQCWCKNGKLHREDGPAAIYSNGTQCWYKNDKLHRENGPAVIYPNGRKEWWESDKFIKRS